MFLFQLKSKVAESQKGPESSQDLRAIWENALKQQNVQLSAEAIAAFVEHTRLAITKESAKGRRIRLGLADVESGRKIAAAMKMVVKETGADFSEITYGKGFVDERGNKNDYYFKATSVSPEQAKSDSFTRTEKGVVGAYKYSVTSSGRTHAPIPMPAMQEPLNPSAALSDTTELQMTGEAPYGALYGKPLDKSNPEARKNFYEMAKYQLSAMAENMGSKPLNSSLHEFAKTKTGKEFFQKFIEKPLAVEGWATLEEPSSKAYAENQAFAEWRANEYARAIVSVIKECYPEGFSKAEIKIQSSGKVFGMFGESQQEKQNRQEYFNSLSQYFSPGNDRYDDASPEKRALARTLYSLLLGDYAGARKLAVSSEIRSQKEELLSYIDKLSSTGKSAFTQVANKEGAVSYELSDVALASRIFLRMKSDPSLKEAKSKGDELGLRFEGTKNQKNQTREEQAAGAHQALGALFTDVLINGYHRGASISRQTAVDLSLQVSANREKYSAGDRGVATFSVTYDADKQNQTYPQGMMNAYLQYLDRNNKMVLEPLEAKFIRKQGWSTVFEAPFVAPEGRFRILAQASMGELSTKWAGADALGTGQSIVMKKVNEPETPSPSIRTERFAPFETSSPISITIKTIDVGSLINDENFTVYGEDICTLIQRGFNESRPLFRKGLFTQGLSKITSYIYDPSGQNQNTAYGLILANPAMRQQWESSINGSLQSFFSLIARGEFEQANAMIRPGSLLANIYVSPTSVDLASDRSLADFVQYKLVTRQAKITGTLFKNDDLYVPILVSVTETKGEVEISTFDPLKQSSLSGNATVMFYLLPKEMFLTVGATVGKSKTSVDSEFGEIEVGKNKITGWNASYGMQYKFFEDLIVGRGEVTYERYRVDSKTTGSKKILWSVTPSVLITTPPMVLFNVPVRPVYEGSITINDAVLENVARKKLRITGTSEIGLEAQPFYNLQLPEFLKDMKVRASLLHTATNFQDPHYGGRLILSFTPFGDNKVEGSITTKRD